MISPPDDFLSFFSCFLLFFFKAGLFYSFYFGIYLFYSSNGLSSATFYFVPSNFNLFFISFLVFYSAFFFSASFYRLILSSNSSLYIFTTSSYSWRSFLAKFSVTPNSSFILFLPSSIAASTSSGLTKILNFYKVLIASLLFRNYSTS